MSDRKHYDAMREQHWFVHTYVTIAAFLGNQGNWEEKTDGSVVVFRKTGDHGPEDPYCVVELYGGLVWVRAPYDGQDSRQIEVELTAHYGQARPGYLRFGPPERPTL